MTHARIDSFRLAVVIPAYKEEFLAKALDSLLAQTCRKFHVYIGDDASPHPLQSICEASKDAGLPLTYHRFESNQGAHNLVAQWNRCVHLSGGEEWVWLFSDDDIADPRCVEQFFKVAVSAEPEVNVLRFNSVTINRHGEITGTHPLHPAIESVEAFAYHRLTFQRKSYAPDHIFRRAAFDRHGGFVSFPFALGSDDASWITFAENGPLVTIPEARIFWRHSGLNVSHLGAGQPVEKLLALTNFGDWLRNRFAVRPVRLSASAEPVNVDFATLVHDWFTFQAAHVPDLPLVSTWRFAQELERRSFGSRHYWMLRILRRRLGRYRRRFLRAFKGLPKLN